MDLRLERLVALKVLKVVDAKQRGILLAEAKTACQLQHPNIAVVFEAGEVDGAPFIAMEFAEGETLRTRLGQPQPEAMLRKLLTQAVSALAHAHDKGIVHRDIKPDNLLLTPQGDLKLLDFGIAKRGTPGGEPTQGHAFTLSDDTQQGYSQGTPGYMSPEQALGRAIGPASDQFSLALSLYELAAGFHPFRTPTLLGTFQAIVHDPAPDLAQLREDLSPGFVAVLRRMMEKQPEDRLPSMEVLLRMLADDASGAAPILASSAPESRRLRRWWMGGVAGLALVALGSALWWIRLRPAAAGQAAGGERRAVAILPLDLQGLPPGQQWLGESFQDAMATGLLRRGDLLVLDRTRVAETLAEAKLGGVHPGPKQICSLLGAELLLMGSLQASGERMRLSLRLIRGQKGEVIDQIVFEGKLTDTLSFEEELGRRVPALFGASHEAVPGVGSQARLTRTRECYIRGLELVDTAGAEDTKQAVQAFEEALRSEPDYAPAHAGLAWALGGLHAQAVHLGKDQTQALLEHAIDEVRQAIALDPRLPLSHRILGQLLDRQGDHGGARLALQTAVSLDPADYRALATLGDSFAYSDDPASRAQARSYFKRALDLHPRFWWANYRMGVLLLNEGDLKGAGFHADRARQLQPTADYAHLVSAIARLWSGDLSGSAQRLEEGLRLVPNSGLLELTRVLCDYARGDHASFQTHLQTRTGSWVEPHPIGVLLRGLEAGMAGDRSAMKARFVAFAETHRSRDLTSVPTSERRIISVNAYHMARALAQGGEAKAARSLLDLAETMQPGKARVAAQDPLMVKVTP